jgi:hypothetical protein
MIEITTKICTKCKKELPATGEYFQRNKDGKFGLRSTCKTCSKDRQSLYLQEMKLMVIDYYGGSCAVCGITNPAFLCIDHMNNDGAEHRKETGLSGGFLLYRWLRDNKFPPGFQVLCWNHNHLKQLEVLKRSNLQTTKPVIIRRCIRKRKVETINHYGIVCACCGEDNVDLLTIDHVNGGGKKHRKEIGVRAGYGFYSWLRNNNFPTGFQVLCFNCNDGRSVNGGICPHEVGK